MKLRKENKAHIFKDVLDMMFKYFCIITTVLLIINGVTALFSYDGWALYRQDIFRVLLLAFVSVLPFLIDVFFEAGTNRQITVLLVLRFIITAILVSGVLFFIETGADFISIRTGVIFLFVYAVLFGYGTIRARVFVIRINAKLDELHKAENATHINENVKRDV